ncbi:PIR protein [Plasmodium vivax]|uniref:VIR protein n=1 Tax=Plasmodium vivax TaxID=5855 RepID=A0A565A8A1_PLAVI|nr:PIR protein [Plasmodium vivax]
MTISRTDSTYLNYYEYNQYKSKFKIDDSYRSSDEIRILKDKYIKTLPTDTRNLHDAFNLLVKYLSNGGVLYDHNGYHVCRYISYKIHEKIIELNNGVCNDVIFNFFKDFVAMYNNEKGNNICRSYINYIDNDTYRKMKMLYSLFDKFISLKKLQNDSSSCKTLNFLVHSYNDVVRNYNENDSNLFNKLKDLKYIIETSEWESNTTCESRVSHLLPLKPDNSHEKQVEQKQNTESESQKNAMQQKADIQEIKTTIELKEYSALQGVEELNGRTEFPREKTTRDGETLPEREELPEILSIPLKENENTVHQISLLGNTRGGVENEILPVEGGIYHTIDPTRIPQDPQNFLGTMKNAISGFMNEVEPAPILGVSGGMGALFLLFKYTPVGTFFRGGRRINNRIPRTFYGQFAGGPAGYDDFYEGSFGPGPINISYRPELE